jgi:vancomycin resistance protein YoaR
MSKNEKIFAIILTIELIFVGFVAVEIIYYNQYIQAEINLHAPAGYKSKVSDALAGAVASPVILKYSDQYSERELVIPETQIQEWVESYFREYTQRYELKLNDENISDFVESVAPGINTQPTNGIFAMNEGVLEAVVPSSKGGNLNIEKSVAAIKYGLSKNSQPVHLVIDDIEPEISLNKLRELNITTLLSAGTSNFSGSSWSRVKNIEVGASKFHGKVIRPGEEFSFNTILGPITPAQGYVPGLVIKGSKLVPEYGGGICQVSTTMFRAAMEAGLEIVERKAHSLPVRFYNPQGYDSTIYPGVVDLKFINDTPSYILIQTRISGTQLTFEMYGQSDGREVVVSRPVIYSAPGDGSLKTRLSRVIVSADGEEATDEYYSSYRAPGQFEVIRNPLE